jgi:hypothetical protein
LFSVFTVDWEGPDAVEECDDEPPPARAPASQSSQESTDEEPPEGKLEFESDDGGTEDEYIAENKPKGRGVANKV